MNSGITFPEYNDLPGLERKHIQLRESRWASENQVHRVENFWYHGRRNVSPPICLGRVFGFGKDCYGTGCVAVPNCSNRTYKGFFPGDDHGSLWQKVAKGDDRFYYVSQPYSINEVTIHELAKIAFDTGANITVDARSYHNPGLTLMIVISNCAKEIQP